MIITGLPANKCIVETKRCGGGFGCKISRCQTVAAATTICALKYNVPVRIQTDRNTEMKMAGNRCPFKTHYKVGFNPDGSIVSLDLKFYVDGGFSYDCSMGMIGGAQLDLDNVYMIPNYRSEGVPCRTNLPPNTSMRAPGTVNAMLIIESVLEDVANHLNKSSFEVRSKNFYKDGQTTPIGEVLTPFTLPKVISQLNAMNNIDNRLSQIEQFNSQNRWRKRGLGFVPTKYAIRPSIYFTVVELMVYPKDGTIFVNHSGCEIGQGLNTKVAQAIAMALELRDLNMIRFGTVSSEKIPNFTTTGGSGTSEAVVAAAILACTSLQERLAPIRKNLSDSSTWVQVIQAASEANIDLFVTGFHPSQRGVDYYVYAAALSEVEIDVLTGEVEVNQVDISYDCGRSLNPGNLSLESSKNLIHLIKESISDKLKDPSFKAWDSV